MESTAPLDNAVVGLRDAYKRYSWSAPWVLHGLDVGVEASTLADVRGVNGSGKSTLLRLLAGATVPTRGRRVAAPGITVGYTPERLAPPPPFSAAAFLRHHARLRGLAEQDGVRRVRALADRLAAGGLLEQRLAALSKGSLQKIVLIAALFGEPGLVVLDEPFGGLDADAQQALGEILRERADGGAAVIFSDHRPADAHASADVTWHVADGGVRRNVRTRADADGVDRLAGMLEARVDAEQLELRVRAAAGDDVLAALLARRWHIVAVGPGADGEVLITARRAGRA